MVPVVFDEGLNEYHLEYDGPNGRGKLLLRYCPFCGGAAPKSRRADLFMRLTQTEQSRLRKLTSGLRSRSAVLEALGPPDRELDPGDGVGLPAKEGAPPGLEYCRTMVFENLSETADVRVTERSDGTIGIALTAKPAGSGKH